MDKLLYKKELLGIRIRKIRPGSLPASEEAHPLQVLTLKYDKGHSVAPHAHKPLRRVTTGLQECIIVRKGRVRIDLYGSGKKVLRRAILNEGDVFVTISGGHSIHFLEDSEIIETKNGPFAADKISIGT